MNIDWQNVDVAFLALLLQVLWCSYAATRL
jgi:hypothetical protein